MNIKLGAGALRLGVAAFLGFVGAFQAVAIPSGQIAIVGIFSPSGGTGLGDATSVNFAGDSLVVGATGSFADYLTPFVSTASISSFQFDPFTDPVDPLWEAGGFSFRLDSISVVAQTDGHLALSGVGVLNGNGFSDTPGTWDFLGYGSGLFVFRSDESVQLTGFAGGSPETPVPDGGNTLLLLGAVLIALIGSMAWAGKRCTT